MRIYGFYNNEGVYPNLLTTIYEQDGLKYTQVVQNDEVQEYLPIDISHMNPQHIYLNSSSNRVNPSRIIYAFMTRGKELYCSDKRTMQRTVQSNLPFVDINSPVYDKLKSFVSSQDSAQ